MTEPAQAQDEHPDLLGLKSYALTPWVFVSYAFMLIALIVFGVDPKNFLVCYAGELLFLLGERVVKLRVSPGGPLFVIGTALIAPLIIGLLIVIGMLLASPGEGGSAWGALVVVAAFYGLLTDRFRRFRATTLRQIHAYDWLNANYIRIQDGQRKIVYPDTSKLLSAVLVAKDHLLRHLKIMVGRSATSLLG